MAMTVDRTGPAPAAEAVRPKRRKGRPAGADRSVGPEKILHAARTLLGRLPSSRVTLTAVAREAGVDPALIRYYFKDRSSLLQEIIASLMRENSAPGVFDPARPVLEQMRDHCRGFFRFIDANSYVHRLMLDEIAQSDDPEHRELLASLNVKARSFFGAILDGMRTRADAPKLEPLIVQVALIGMSEFFGTARPILEAVIGPELDMDRLRQDYADFISTALIEGLRRRLG
jgi:AcrR family transcriptional regulator